MLKQILDRANKRKAELGITQFEVAERGGISKDVFRNISEAIEKGKGHGVSTNTLQGLALGLGVTVEWLFFGRNEDTDAKASNLDKSILGVALAYRDMEVQRSREPMRFDDEVDFIFDKYNEILKNTSVSDDIETSSPDKETETADNE